MFKKGLVPLGVAAMALSLSGCFGGEEEKEQGAGAPVPVTLEVQETKRPLDEEIKRIRPAGDDSLNKAILLEDGGILLVTYSADNCVTAPNYAKWIGGSTLSIEIPEPQPLIACEGEIKPRGWDITVPGGKEIDIKSAELMFPDGKSGGISLYSDTMSPDIPEEVKTETPKAE